MTTLTISILSTYILSMIGSGVHTYNNSRERSARRLGKRNYLIIATALSITPIMNTLCTLTFIANLVYKK
ncbi:MAG TPA: hypothetical protein VFL70_07810 [Bacteroidia bacterium]|nr:hypothetical protein [Bacteroidia bacterium]HNO71696.1 hypothetical protein [Bacteroidia bacterium]